MSVVARVITLVHITFAFALWSVKEAQSAVREIIWKSSLTISAKPVGVGAMSQPRIPTGERSELLTHTAMTENVTLCERMKS
jgi:hypothetical protein